MTVRGRFDVVVANCNRSELFWNAYGKMLNLRPGTDRLIFMDCSRRPEEQLEACLRSAREAGLPATSFFFFHRRNWNLNHGAQLDYVRLVGDGVLDASRYVLFMQDHYLNTDQAVKGDTIPDGHVVDVDCLADFHSTHPDHVWFCARNGFRVSASVPESIAPADCDNFTQYPGSRPISFCVDGGNFSCPMEPFLDHYRDHRQLYTEGDGSYAFCHVWETRLSKILYDKGLTFYDASSGRAFRRVEELTSAFPQPVRGTWAYFYNFAPAYLVYGRDIWRYAFKPSYPYVRALARFLYHSVRADRDVTVKRMFPFDTDSTATSEALPPRAHAR